MSGQMTLDAGEAASATNTPAIAAAERKLPRILIMGSRINLERVDVLSLIQDMVVQLSLEHPDGAGPFFKVEPSDVGYLAGYTKLGVVGGEMVRWTEFPVFDRFRLVPGTPVVRSLELKEKTGFGLGQAADIDPQEALSRAELLVWLFRGSNEVERSILWNLTSLEATGLKIPKHSRIIAAHAISSGIRHGRLGYAPGRYETTDLKFLSLPDLNARRQSYEEYIGATLDYRFNVTAIVDPVLVQAIDKHSWNAEHDAALRTSVTKGDFHPLHRLIGLQAMYALLRQQKASGIQAVDMQAPQLISVKDSVIYRQGEVLIHQLLPQELQFDWVLLPNEQERQHGYRPDREVVVWAGSGKYPPVRGTGWDIRWGCAWSGALFQLFEARLIAFNHPIPSGRGCVLTERGMALLDMLGDGLEDPDLLCRWRDPVTGEPAADFASGLRRWQERAFRKLKRRVGYLGDANRR